MEAQWQNTGLTILRSRVEIIPLAQGKRETYKNIKINFFYSLASDSSTVVKQ
jgi:hypothetical protein